MISRIHFLLCIKKIFLLNTLCMSIFVSHHISSSPEYAVVENEAEMDEEMCMHAGSTLPTIPSPGSGRPPPQYNQHLHFPHHQISDDPEPYASATLVQPPNMREYPARRQNCSDNSSEWSGSWQSSNRDGRRPGRMVKPGGHGSPRGWHAPYDGPPAVPDRGALLLFFIIFCFYELILLTVLLKWSLEDAMSTFSDGH